MKKGFTLLEVVVAIALVGIAFYAIIVTFMNIVTNQVDVDAVTKGTYLAEGKLEELTARSFAGISSESGSFSGNFSQYSYTVVVNSVEASDLVTVASSSNLKRIDIYVTGGVIGSSIEVSTIKGNIE
ncbi:MAG: type II secretion system GspH family protein [Candidatus Margulisbacteria bacterium]|nr:type II secretion system GspH family protein [Candidatus Margulisiibacteriota bacterium]